MRKPDNSLRLCIDYRLLNAKTVADKHPIPNVQETLENLGGNSGSQPQTKERLINRALCQKKANR